jgi:hypothetical protein
MYMEDNHGKMRNSHVQLTFQIKFIICGILCTFNMRLLQNDLGITLLLRNAKQYNHLSYISSKIVPLCNYTLLPATEKVLETFLINILQKPFRLFRRILNNVSSIIKVPSLQCSLQSKKQVKTNRSQVRRVSRMLQCCHIVLY